MPTVAISYELLAASKSATALLASKAALDGENFFVTTDKEGFKNSCTQ